MKRLMAIIFILVIMINSFPILSFASSVDVKSSTSTPDVTKEDNIYQKAVDVLEICGIASKRDKDNYVTNQEFALSIVQLLNMSNIASSGSEIEFLKESKIISDSMRFLPDTIIMTDEALEICVNALGYREKAQHTGYEKIIRETDLNNNIVVNGKLTHENLTLLLYNALLAPLNEIIAITGKYLIYNNDGNILNTYHQIYCIRDIILASDIVAVKNYEKYISKDRIYMDGLSIRAYNSSILDYCGYEAEVYIKKDATDTYNVCLYYITDFSNSQTTLIEDVYNVSGFDAGDPIQDRKHPKITFWVSKREKNIKIETDATVVYNGSVTESISNADFFGETGEVRFVDSDDNGYFDIIYIRKYVVGAVDKINIENSTILLDDGRKYTFKDVEYIKVVDNKRVKSFSGIGEGDVICIFVAKGNVYGERSEIHILSNVIKGELTSLYSGESILEINDVSYRYNSELQQKLKLGNEYYFYLDGKELVAHVKPCEENTQYAYFLDYVISERTFSKTIKIKMMFLGGESEIIEVPKNIKYTGLDENGTWIDYFTVNNDRIERIFAANFTEHQLIKVKIVDDVLKQIIMPKDMSSLENYKGYTEDEFTLEEIIGLENSETLRQKTKISSKYAARSISTLVVIDNVSDEEDIEFTEYTLGAAGILSAESFCLNSAKIYDANEDGTIGVIVVKYDPTMTDYTVKASNHLANGSRVVVETVITALDDNGDTTYIIEGYAGGWKVRIKAKNTEVIQKFNTVYASRNSCGIESLECGDVIIPEFDKNGEMCNYYIILDKSETDPTSGNYLCYSGHNETQHTHNLNTVYGNVRRNYENKVITIENVFNHMENPENPKQWINDTNSYTKFLVHGNISSHIYICDQARGEIFVAQDEYINDALNGNPDTVFIARTTQNTNFIVIYR